MEPKLACPRCETGFRDPGTSACSKCVSRSEEDQRRYCKTCGVGWHDLDAHGRCEACTVEMRVAS